MVTRLWCNGSIVESFFTESLGQWRHQIKYKMPMVARNNSDDKTEANGSDRLLSQQRHKIKDEMPIVTRDNSADGGVIK